MRSPRFVERRKWEMPSFDLLTEPWICAVRRDGSEAELGLRELLISAHALREIRDPMPTVEFGLHRLLVAMVMDIFKMTEMADLTAVLDAGRFDPDAIDAYFGTWADRFDLFHPTHPFLQCASMDDKPAEPITRLLPPVPSGTGAIHFFHVKQGDFGVSPAAAARLLTTLAPFATAGGAGLSPSINGAPPWYVLIRGGSVFETLCINSCVISLNPTPTGAVPPAWRNPCPIPSARCTSVSLLEALTWRPRRVQLIPGEDGVCSLTNAKTPALISTMRFAAGASCDFDWQDPSVPYRIAENGSFVLRPRDDREVWRDIGPLALLRACDFTSRDGNVRYARPRVVDQLAELVASDSIRPGSGYSLTAYGIRTDMKMKVYEWRRERLSPPIQLIADSRLTMYAQRAMEAAEIVEYSLGRALKHVYPRAGASRKNVFDSIIDGAKRDYWTDVRPLYEQLMEDITDPRRKDRSKEGLASYIDSWMDDLRMAGAQAFDSATEDLDSDGNAIRRLVEARKSFRQHVDAALCEDEDLERTLVGHGAEV
jgi:CRISPR system Cascade subunit CasA